jgi:hypothetical protein
MLNIAVELGWGDSMLTISYNHRLDNMFSCLKLKQLSVPLDQSVPLPPLKFPIEFKEFSLIHLRKQYLFSLLLLAVERNDRTLVLDLLEFGITVECRGQSAFRVAIDHKNPDIMTLIAQKSDGPVPRLSDLGYALEKAPNELAVFAQMTGYPVHDHYVDLKEKLSALLEKSKLKK